MPLVGYKFNPFSGELFPLTTASEAGAAPLNCAVKHLGSAMSYRLQAEDAGTLIVTGGGPIQVPEDASVEFPVGTQILCFDLAPATVEFIPDAGVQLSPTATSSAQVLIKIDANHWAVA
jgi:hypothetical protein